MTVIAINLESKKCDTGPLIMVELYTTINLTCIIIFMLHISKESCMSVKKLSDIQWQQPPKSLVSKYP